MQNLDKGRFHFEKSISVIRSAVSMEVGRVLSGSLILSFLLSLFAPLPVKYLSGNGLYYFSCTPLRFDCSMPSLEVITDHRQVNSVPLGD